jgi:excisionase family DNA binding protein
MMTTGRSNRRPYLSYYPIWYRWCWLVTEWLTIQEAMQKLRVSRATIYRWAKAGRVTIHQLGPRSSRISREDIERLEREAPKLYED